VHEIGDLLVGHAAIDAEERRKAGQVSFPLSPVAHTTMFGVWGRAGILHRMGIGWMRRLSLGAGILRGADGPGKKLEKQKPHSNSRGNDGNLFRSLQISKSFDQIPSGAKALIGLVPFWHG
jgi:hypothetical protein